MTKRYTLLIAISMVAVSCGDERSENELERLSIPDSLYTVPVSMRNYTVSQEYTDVSYRYRYDEFERYASHQWSPSGLRIRFNRLDGRNMVETCQDEHFIDIREFDGQYRAIYAARARPNWSTEEVRSSDEEEVTVRVTTTVRHMISTVPIRYVDFFEGTIESDKFVRIEVDSVVIDYDLNLNPVEFFNHINVAVSGSASAFDCIP